MWSQQGLTVEELAEVWLWMTAHVPLRPTEKGAAIGTAQELQSSDVLTRTASIRLDQDPRFLKAWERHGRSSLPRSDLFNDRVGSCITAAFIVMRAPKQVLSNFSTIIGGQS